MIQSKEDLEYYLKQDELMLSPYLTKRRFLHPRSDIWTYQILLRKCEYYMNCRHDLFSRIWLKFLKYRFFRLSRITGLKVSFNVCGPGLSLVHEGCIVISPYARIGKNCRIAGWAVIGQDELNNKKAAQIGDNVFIGVGAKIIGDVKIADNVVIGANAVVIRDITEPGTAWAGVPARKVSDKDSSGYMVHPELLEK